MDTREQILQKVAEKYGIERSRLEELIDERDNEYGVIAANVERALGVGVKGNATFATPNPGSYFRGLSYQNEAEGGQDTDVRVYGNDDVQVTERRMSPAMLAAITPPAEPMITTPVLPGKSTPLLIPEVHDHMTREEAVEAMRAVTTRQIQQSMANQQQAIEAAKSQAGEQIAAYIAAHPEYDFAAGTPQQPTPGVYSGGGLAEELFGVSGDDMPGVLREQYKPPDPEPAD